MEAEKRSSKGGFFQLFDWNVKSKKKLFSNKSSFPECSNQGKENFSASEASQLQQMNMHEIGPSTSVQGNDYNCISTVSSEEGHGTKVPGVVARLMGLDSLPKKDISEPPYDSSFYDSYSLRDSHLPRTQPDIQSEHHIIDYGNTRNKLDGFSRNPVDFRMQKVQNRSIDRFQTEILPPKSARTISSSHNRLLSPIKSPGFILTKNAASIMEAASRIIEQSPQSTTKGKSSFGSPSVPLRIRDLKEKLEAAQKAPQVPVQSQRARDNHSGKYMKRQPNERGQRGIEDAQLLRHSVAQKQGGSRSLKNKEKTPSFSSQAKTNFQMKEGPSWSGNRSLNQKVDNRVKPNHLEKKELYTEKSVQRRTSASGTSDVLKQNNQKQNRASSKETTGLKPQTASCQQDKKVLSSKSSSRVNKTVNKIAETSSTGTGKKNTVAADTRKEISSSNSKSFLAKKRPVSAVARNNGNAVKDVLINKNDRSVKCNVSVDGLSNWDAVDTKSGMDVVSFTFTSPIKKSIPGSQAPGQFREDDNSLSVVPANDKPTNVSYLSSLGLNVIGSDALSVLLEEKLKELACRVEPSDSNLIRQHQFSGPASSLHDSAPFLSVTDSTCTENEKNLHLGLHKHNQENQHDFNHSSLDGMMLDAKQKWKESEDFEESSNGQNNNKTEHGQETDCPISSQPSYSGESCTSLDSKVSYTSNGNRQCSSLESYETVSFISSRHPHYFEELELSDSASSLSVGGVERKDRACTPGYRNFEQSPNWELVYTKEVLSNADLQLDDYVLDQARLSADFFYSWDEKIGSDKAVDEYYKLEQNLVIDFLNECLEFRCEQISVGSRKAWSKLTMLFQNKERLAEEFHREMSGLTSMKDLLTDEIVDREMSSHYGKWVDFETEECEESLELGDEILSSLVDEIMIDLLS
ncbi:VARLMGL domain-containing protein [Heracleum sosnowskyi]|uniref:VARLMGL domain-containing protein n=1 Tax=Heracleum sosnowskyi TaxID=360622 RepID=A0AAD8JES4_9APIA|nr:VARLMGL domain-containing protein [Heracleum sosnowskyi]